MKLSKSHKFIIPLALVKIILAYLVLQLFFSSCENDDILYGSDLYTEGPVFEIKASLGNDKVEFETESDANGIEDGDTLYLEITMESNSLFDQISKSNVPLSNPAYYGQFAITDVDGHAVAPQVFEVSGQVDYASEVYEMSFGDVASAEVLMSPVRAYATQLKIGFVFQQVGSYTFHFINTPNTFTDAGTVDVFYDRNPEDSKDVKKAYAVYLFDTDKRSHDYGSKDDSYASSVLLSAGADQGIIDFTIIEKN